METSTHEFCMSFDKREAIMLVYVLAILVPAKTGKKYAFCYRKYSF